MSNLCGAASAQAKGDVLTDQQTLLKTTIEPIAFKVLGKPATQGSKTEQVIRDRKGEPIIKNGRALTTIREANPRLAQWRQEVAYAASKAYGGPLLIGAIRLSLVFYRPRPQDHFGTGRNAGKLKESAEDYPIQRPDLLKLARAVEDACTGILWADDSHIVQETLAKDWGHFAVSVLVESLYGRTR